RNQRVQQHPPVLIVGLTGIDAAQLVVGAGRAERLVDLAAERRILLFARDRRELLLAAGSDQSLQRRLAHLGVALVAVHLVELARGAAGAEELDRLAPQRRVLLGLGRREQALLVALHH